MTKFYSSKANAKRAAKTVARNFREDYPELDPAIQAVTKDIADKPHHFIEMSFVSEPGEIGAYLDQCAILVEAETEVEAEAAAEEETPAPEQNADVDVCDELKLTASVIKDPCKLVWDIAEEMKGQRRKDIINHCVAKGVAYNTARTQYQLWFQASKK